MSKRTPRIRNKIVGWFATLLTCTFLLGLLADGRLAVMGGAIVRMGNVVLPSVKALDDVLYETTAFPPVRGEPGDGHRSERPSQ